MFIIHLIHFNDFILNFTGINKGLQRHLKTLLGPMAPQSSTTRLYFSFTFISFLLYHDFICNFTLYFLQQSISSLEDNRRHHFIKPRRQPEASLQLVPVDNQRKFRHHLSSRPRRQPEASFKSPNTTGGLIYHSSL